MVLHELVKLILPTDGEPDSASPLRVTYTWCSARHRDFTPGPPATGPNRDRRCASINDAMYRRVNCESCLLGMNRAGTHAYTHAVRIYVFSHVVRICDAIKNKSTDSLIAATFRTHTALLRKILCGKTWPMSEIRRFNSSLSHEFLY